MPKQFYYQVIQGSGGLRKMRWAYGNKGKSGGSRVIYYYHKSEFEILMLTIYAKNEKESLSKLEVRAMMRTIDAIRKGT